MNKIILIGICIVTIFESCSSIRTSQRIEKAFLNAYKKDTINGFVPKNYRVKEINANAQRLNLKVIDVYLIDSITESEVIIDDFKSIKELAKNKKECKPYIKKFERQKMMQKINRYGSYGLMVGGIAILSSVGDTPTPSKSERIRGNAGAYTLLVGFLNWIGGGIDRQLIRRCTTMKIAYIYHFGKPPKNWRDIK